MRQLVVVFLVFWSQLAYSQIYTVNSNDDVDDGVCDGVHCSFREAIKASEADGVPSVINFNIPGAGTMTINPTGPFPSVLQDDLTILGETQPGGPGTVVIDFNYRNMMGVPFWAIHGQRFYISGIDFTDFLFDNNGDCIFQFGDFFANSSNSRIFNCAFIQDNSFNPALDKTLILVNKAFDLSISNCFFGTDHTASSIFKLEGNIFVDNLQLGGTVTIDSNIFVNKSTMIEYEAGTLSISKNIFGALDTSKNANFLNPDQAILGWVNDYPSQIVNNFFYGFTGRAIRINSNDILTITKNRFHFDAQDMELQGTGPDISFITENYARNGGLFLNTREIDEIYVERNNISLYDTVMYHQNNPVNQKIRHIDNRMTCIDDAVIIMDQALFPARPIPVISSVNRNQIKGTGNPNDTVVVYSNNRITCPNAVCQAGVELGRTRADAAGNWVLNANYPNRTTISAYQYDSNPNQRPTLYSEFSACYFCPGRVDSSFTASLCSGQTITYRGKVYSEANPKDSFVIVGDGISICDSLFLVNITFGQGFRVLLNLPLCYDDTLRFGTVEIHKNHLADSLLLKTSSGCDSIVNITAREVGITTFHQTICDNASITIGGTRFDKNNPSGTAVIPGAAEGGCDSILFVNLTINNFTESFLNRTMCPGQNLTIGSEVFDSNRPSGDVTLPFASSTGCDSVIHVNLNYPNNTGSYFQTICNGDSIFIIDRFFSNQNTNAVITLANGSSFGCDSIITVNVGILPNANGTYTNEICRDDTLNLNGELFFSGHTTGTLLLTNLAANGCDSIVDVKITIIPDAIGDLDTTLCENQTLTLYGELFSVSRPSGSLRIDDASSRMCDSFLNVTVNFIPESTGSFTTTICRKDSIQVGNQFFSASNPTGSVRFPGGSAAGCDSVVNVAVNINPSLFLNFDANDLKCNQANTGEIILNSIGGGSGNYQFSIDGGAVNNYSQGLVVGNLSQGNHMIRILDQLGCDTSFNFTVNNSQVLFLALPNDTTIKKGSSININAFINFNAAFITWDPATYLSCSNCLNPQSTPDQTISYTLTVTDDQGCTISDNMTITVFIDEAEVYIPTAFSPNGDNINDIFTPVFKDPDKASILIFRIFDRWGNMLYEHTNGLPGEAIGWNGEIDKEKVNPGVYVYAIQFAGEDSVARWIFGDITVIR